MHQTIARTVPAILSLCTLIGLAAIAGSATTGDRPFGSAAVTSHSATADIVLADGSSGHEDTGWGG